MPVTVRARLTCIAASWHWAEVVAEGRAVHVGYTITRGDVTDLALEVEALAGSSRVAVVVLDLRQNGGGDNRTYRPLLESLQRLGSEKRLAVLTSRVTFSAAMQLVVDLERDTQAVFVGEPTGGSPNQYGDATKVELPNSGLNAFVATVAWKTAGELRRSAHARARHPGSPDVDRVLRRYRSRARRSPGRARLTLRSRAVAG